MKKCDTYRKRAAKFHFLSKNWCRLKFLYMIFPAVIATGVLIFIIGAFIEALKAFIRTLIDELQTAFADLFGKNNHNPFMLWWMGWRYWSQRSAANYLYGLTDEEERGEEWPKITAEQEIRAGLAREVEDL